MKKEYKNHTLHIPVVICGACPFMEQDFTCGMDDEGDYFNNDEFYRPCEKDDMPYWCPLREKDILVTTVE